METAVRLNLNLTVLVLNDNAYGMIKWKQNIAGFPKSVSDSKKDSFIFGVLSCQFSHSCCIYLLILSQFCKKFIALGFFFQKHVVMLFVQVWLRLDEPRLCCICKQVKNKLLKQTLILSRTSLIKAIKK
jgi:hypothetical protein